MDFEAAALSPWRRNFSGRPEVAETLARSGGSNCDANAESLLSASTREHASVTVGLEGASEAGTLPIDSSSTFPKGHVYHFSMHFLSAKPFESFLSHECMMSSPSAPCSFRCQFQEI